jgi:hypothetical protein
MTPYQKVLQDIEICERHTTCLRFLNCLTILHPAWVQSTTRTQVSKKIEEFKTALDSLLAVNYSPQSLPASSFTTAALPTNYSNSQYSFQSTSSASTTYIPQSYGN